MTPLSGMVGAAGSHGLLMGQIFFSATFVVACELWLLPTRLPHKPPSLQELVERCGGLEEAHPGVAGSAPDAPAGAGSAPTGE